MRAESTRQSLLKRSVSQASRKSPRNRTTKKPKAPSATNPQRRPSVRRRSVSILEPDDREERATREQHDPCSAERREQGVEALGDQGSEGSDPEEGGRRKQEEKGAPLNGVTLFADHARRIFGEEDEQEARQEGEGRKNDGPQPPEKAIGRSQQASGNRRGRTQPDEGDAEAQVVEPGVGEREVEPAKITPDRVEEIVEERRVQLAHEPEEAGERHRWKGVQLGHAASRRRAPGDEGPIKERRERHSHEGVSTDHGGDPEPGLTRP